MTDSSMVIVVGASEGEFDHVKQCLSDWQCVAESLNDNGVAVSSMPATPGLFVIYAQKSEKSTLAICKQLRNPPETSAVPILLVISRYEIPQGYAVKRMGNATFIMTPFKEEELREKFGMEPTKVDNRTAILIVKTTQKGRETDIGIVVDRMVNVLEIGDDDIEDVPQFGTDVDVTFVRGFGKVNDSVMALLDIDKVLSGDDLDSITKVD